MDEVQCTPVPGGSSVESRRFRKRIISAAEDHPISTNVQFADREASLQAAATIDTETELAKLYAHLSSMPESAKKMKLINRFKNNNGGLAQAAATPDRNHKRSRSLGASLKKLVGRSTSQTRNSKENAQQAEAKDAPPTPTSPAPSQVRDQNFSPSYVHMHYHHLPLYFQHLLSLSFTFVLCFICFFSSFHHLVQSLRNLPISPLLRLLYSVCLWIESADLPQHLPNQWRQR